MAPRALSFAFFVSFFFFSFSFAEDVSMSMESLDSIIRYQAFDQLARHHTGRLFEVHLPPELAGAGVRASAVRLRGSDIWRKEASFDTFTIGPMAMTAPYARRLIAVFLDLGHLSSSYFRAPENYSLVSPVTGLLVYDANATTTSGGVRQIDFFVTGGPLTIRFPEFTSREGENAEIKCARLERNGTVELFRRTSESVCSTKSTGHFAMVMGWLPDSSDSTEDLGSSPAAIRKNTINQRKNWMIVVGIVSGGGIVLIFCVVGMVGMVRHARNKKMEEMLLQAEEGEALDEFWIGRSKVPSASMTRTQPQLEDYRTETQVGTKKMKLEFEGRVRRFHQYSSVCRLSKHR